MSSNNKWSNRFNPTRQLKRADVSDEYIVHLIENTFYDYDEIAREVGMTKNGVRIRYMEYRIRNNEYFQD